MKNNSYKTVLVVSRRERALVKHPEAWMAANAQMVDLYGI